MAKEQASKKKATKTPKGRAKADKPESTRSESKADDSVQEQAQDAPEPGINDTQQEQNPENKPPKKARVSRKSKKSKGKQTGSGDEKPVASPAPVVEKVTDVQPEPAIEGDTAKAAAANEAKPNEKPKPKPRRKAKAKKPVPPTAKTEEVANVEPEGNVHAEEDAKPVAAKKRPKKKKAKKKAVKAEPEQAPGIQRVVVASKNPAKIKAAEMGFSRMFPEKEFVFDGMAVGSGVADQPMTDDETFAGALNRAISARQEQPEGEYWIGLEGGLQEEGDDFYAFAWIVILGPEGLMGKSRTGTFAIPPAVTELVRNGKELGEADDIVFGETNSKHSSGAIGILTHGIMDRATYYSDAVLMALIPFKNPSLYVMQEEVEEEV